MFRTLLKNLGSIISNNKVKISFKTFRSIFTKTKDHTDRANKSI